MLHRKKMLQGACIVAGICLLILLRPFSMSTHQAITLAVVAGGIACWTVQLLPKTLVSIGILALLFLNGSAPARKLLVFPLSANFPMILLCYLFSRGIANTGITGRVLDPLLNRWGRTPAKILLLSVAALVITIYVIPQPLVRLLTIAQIFHAYLSRTTLPERTKQLLLFGLFEFYILVNAAFLKADILFNTSAVGFAGITMGSGAWSLYMTVPTILYCALSIGLFLWMFRKDLLGLSVTIQGEQPKLSTLTRKQRQAAWIVGVTILAWLTKDVHGISENTATLLAVGCMYLLGILKLRDLDSIDVPTLVFLTAAYAIGSAMTASGAAEKLMVVFRRLLPARFGVGYLLILVGITMLLHFLLGSNTTALSVAIPGLMTMTQGSLSPTALTLLVYISLVPHHLLPFHCVGLAIGEGNGYFEKDLIWKFGLPMMGMIFIALLTLYLPWWRMLGLVT